MTQIQDKSIKDTGERMVPAYHKSHTVYGEHIVRYQAAVSLVRNKVVLDIASGSGYGAALLGGAAKKVYGVDVDRDAIVYSKKNYASKAVEFLEGDGVSIPLGDNSVDVVVSFETIEHIKDYETFMGEVKRVLKNDGLFVLSTPNDVEFPETNHFHIHEFERKELERLVKKYFKNSSSYYQGTWLYNALFDERGLTSEWNAAVETMQTAPIQLNKCIYFYILCSNRKITETIQPLAAIAEHYSERSRQEYEVSIRKHMDDQAAIMEDQRQGLEHSAGQVKALEAELKRTKARLDRFYNSVPGKVLRKGVYLKRRLTK